MAAGRDEDIGRLVEEILLCCPLIRSIWLAGAPGESTERPQEDETTLVAFADVVTLHRLRKTPGLHRENVRLCVVTDGDRFQNAWGSEQRDGSLLAWEWRQTTYGEAYYTEPGAVPLRADGDYQRRRRKAVCLWQGINPKIEGAA